jgi:hypothetical protein
MRSNSRSSILKKEILLEALNAGRFQTKNFMILGSRGHIYLLSPVPDSGLLCHELLQVKYGD